MAKLGALPSEAIISGYKGTIDYYYWNGIPCARAWPRSPGHNRAASVQSSWPAFADAARLWNTLDPLVQAAYDRMASGSTLSGRDVMTKIYLNAQSILPY